MTEKLLEIHKLSNLLEELRDYNHIHQKIIKTWGTEEFRPYLIDILYEDKRTDREGFPFKVFNVLKDLLIMHDEMFPHLVPEDSLPWSYIDFNVSQ